MRKAAILFFSLALLAGCGTESPTNNNHGITVTVIPSRTVVDFGDTIQFTAMVYGTDIEAVTWHVNGVAGGDSIYGRIDSAGNYIAPPVEPTESDSAGIEARPVADVSSRRTPSHRA